MRVDNNRRANTIAAAVEAAGVPHVVLLSAIGAQQSDGTGPVLGLGDAETVVAAALVALGTNPRPTECVKLSGTDDLWRIRVRQYGVIQQILDAELIVTS